MSRPNLAVLLRHPRRLGFAIFNLVVVGLLVAWLTATPEAGLADLPNVALVNTGMVFVLAAWVVSWLAWAWMVLRRRRRSRRLVEEQPLISGALAFAVGAAVGAALPHTRKEDALIGDIADSVREEGNSEIKEQVGSAIDKQEQQTGHHAT